MVWGGCLEGVVRVSDWCNMVVWGCVEAVWSKCWGSLEGLGMLSGGCGEACGEVT